MTLVLDAPAELNGSLLLRQLADGGVPAAWLVYRPNEATITVGGVGESQRDAATTVVANHAPTADAAEQDGAQARANEDTLRSRAGAALQANRDFLAISAPNNAQVLAQVKALTRQNNGLIRLILNRLEGTD